MKPCKNRIFLDQKYDLKQTVPGPGSGAVRWGDGFLPAALQTKLQGLELIEQLFVLQRQMAGQIRYEKGKARWGPGGAPVGPGPVGTRNDGKMGWNCHKHA